MSSDAKITLRFVEKNQNFIRGLQKKWVGRPPPPYPPLAVAAAATRCDFYPFYTLISWKHLCKTDDILLPSAYF